MSNINKSEDSLIDDLGDGDIEEGEDVTFNDQNENDTDTTDLVPHSNIHKFNDL